MKPLTGLQTGWVSTRFLGQEEEPEVEAKSSFDNRSPDFPDFFEESDEGDVTFGR